MPIDVAALVTWIKANADLVGIAISLIGFAVTIIGVIRAGNAAAAAKKAAEATGQKIRLLETMVDFAALISLLDEIKRLHREQTPARVLLDRYSSIRKLLVLVRSAQISAIDAHKDKIQNVLVDIKEIEARVERSIQNNTPIDSPKFNRVISGSVDELLEVLTKLKIESGKGAA